MIFDKLINRFFRSNFWNSVFLLAGATSLAQLINIISFPIITRLYSPDEYGVMTIYMAILGIIGLMGSFTYEKAIPIAETDTRSLNVLVLSVIILIIGTSLLFIIILIYGDPILNLIGKNDISNYKYFIPIGFILTGLYTILTQWNIRKNKFRVIGRTKISQSLFGNGSKIIFGLFSAGPFALILGVILGQSAGIRNLATTLFRDNTIKFKQVNIVNIFSSLLRYKQFLYFSAPSLLLVTLSSQLPIIFLSRLYDINTVGQYGLAFSITFLPLKLIGKSIEQVFYAKIAEVGRKDKSQINNISNKLLKKLIPLGTLFAIILFIAGPQFFSIAFGDSWSKAGIFARMLIMYLFTYFIFHPYSSIFLVLEKQKYLFLLNLFKIFSVASIFLLADFVTIDYYRVIFIFSLVMSLIEIIQYIIAKHLMLRNVI